MPWHVVADHTECGQGRFGVVKDDGGELVACHDSRESADDQVKALYASERSGVSGEQRLVVDDFGHAHAPAGSPKGGQYTAKDSGGEKQSGAKKSTARPRGTRPAAKKADSGVLAYDPATGRGPGYGMKGGDPRVRGLQEALNRLGLTDAKGKKLAVDGKLGPLTTQAVKAAQRKLGVEPDGKVTPALLAQLAKAKTIGGKRARDVGLCTRTFDFELRGRNNNGRRLEGYAAVYGHPAKIRDLKGDFEETIRAGAFKRSLEQRTPVMQWEHGRDPRVGRVPIAQILDLDDRTDGLFVAAELYDNPVVEPIRQAIAGGSVNGMSFRFEVVPDGDTWTRNGRTEAREVHDADVHELGPVVFPAYDATSVSVRSLLSAMAPDEIRELVHELRDHLEHAVDLEHEQREREADDDIRAGRVTTYGSDEEFIAALEAAPREQRDTDLTGRPAHGAAGGGDQDQTADDGVRSKPTDPRTRERVLQALGVL